MLKLLIAIAQESGMSETDLKNAKEFLEYNEWGLCFDTLITQLYEYDLPINVNTYSYITFLAQRLKLQPGCYEFVKACTKPGHTLSPAVDKKLSAYID